VSREVTVCAVELSSTVKGMAYWARVFTLNTGPGQHTRVTLPPEGATAKVGAPSAVSTVGRGRKVSVEALYTVVT
jgi:hypothetical protein